MSEPTETSEIPSPTVEAQPQAPAPDPRDAKIAELEGQLATTREQLLRTAADLDNYRRRVQREKDELRRYAVGNLIDDLLPVSDHLQLGIDSARKATEVAAVVGGFSMVVDRLGQVLSQHGLQVIDPAGQPFDANRHEVLAQQPSDTVPEGSVVTVVRKGYWLHDRLLRPASVIVSAGPAAAETPAS